MSDSNEEILFLATVVEAEEKRNLKENISLKKKKKIFNAHFN